MIDLRPDQFDAAIPLFEMNMPNSVRIVSTLEGRTPGKVYVDDVHQPTVSALVINFYNITFLGGNIDQNWIDHVAQELSREDKIRIVWPPLYDAKFKPPTTFSEIVDRYEFYDLSSSLESVAIPKGFDFREMDRELFERCEWYDDLVLAYGSAQNFLQHGIGICLITGGEICCEGYAVWRDHEKFEIGVITHEQYRKRGFAYATCSYLNQLCINKGYSTYWVCNQSNLASVATAQKLGYRVQKEYKWVIVPKSTPES